MVEHFTKLPKPSMSWITMKVKESVLDGRKVQKLISKCLEWNVVRQEESIQ
jgi:hypothetical protein